jgi:hypothetical protein
LHEISPGGLSAVSFTVAVSANVVALAKQAVNCHYQFSLYKREKKWFYRA